MTLAVGARIPDAKLMTMTHEGWPAPVDSGDVLGSGKVVLFAVPGAFTPVCSQHHLSGYASRVHEFFAKGVDRIACIAVNDAFVMEAWAQVRGVDDTILMLSDSSGTFTAAAGMEFDGREFGLGMRSHRYAAIVVNGVVRKLHVEEHVADISVSSAEALLDAL